MKVLHVTTSLNIGGVSRFLTDLLPFQSQNCDVTLLVLQSRRNDFTESLIDKEVEVISLDVDNIYNPLITFKLARIFKSYDIIHVHLFPPLYWAGLASLVSKSKIVYTEHSTNNNRRTKPWLRFFEKFIYNKYAAIVSISCETQVQLLNWLRLSEAESRKKCIVINNGVNPDVFHPEETEDVLEPWLLMHARFGYEKDQKTVIQAMRYLPDSVKLMFAGDGPTKQEYQDLVYELGLEKRIFFLGNRDDIPKLINSSIIGVQSSNFEGFGLSALEIMSCGKPVVASDVLGLSQVVGGAGLLFPQGDYEALARHLTSLLSLPEYYQEVASKCLERAKEYSIQLTVEHYLNVYNKVLKNG